MKKLIMVVAAFALAASVQAASYTWKWTSTLNNPNDAAYSGSVYLFNAGDVAQQTVLTAFLANTGSFASTYASQANASYATSNGKGPTATAIAEADIGTIREVDETTKYVDYYYAAVFTSGEDTYLFLTDTYNALVNASQDTSLSKSLSGSTIAPDDTTTVLSGKVWYAPTSSIPEPTSGLLMLLGVAGLALRRKVK